MILAIVVGALCAPANYLVGFNYAQENGLSNPEGVGLLSALFPPIGAALAASILVKDHL